MWSKILPGNEHPLERGLRVVIGVAALSLVFVGPKTAWGWLGVVPFVTGLLGSCPLYTLFGISTCSAKSKAARSPDPELHPTRTPLDRICCRTVVDLAVESIQ